MSEDAQAKPGNEEARDAEHARARLAAIVESSEDAILAKTLEGVITSWNAGAQRLYGYSAEEVLGKPVALLIPPERPDELPAIMERLRRGERVEPYETVRLHKDGTRVDVSVTVSPIRDGSGAVVGASAVARDVTGRKRAAERQRLLAESGAVLAGSLDYESMLRDVARLAVPGFADFCLVHLRGEDGELRQVAAAHADPAGEAALAELGRLHRPAEHPDSVVGRVLRTGRAEAVEGLPRPAPGEGGRLGEVVRELGPRVGLVAPLAARGRTLGCLSFLLARPGRRYDADDLALAEELGRRAGLAVDNARLYREVREADRRKGEWIALLGHELRNPLGPIVNGLHLLRMPRADVETKERAGEMMERQVRRLARLVDELVAVSRLARGKVELRRERVDLVRVVREAAEGRRGAFEQAGVALGVEWPEGPVWVEGDAGRLGEALGHLLDNAVKFTGRGGRGWVRLEVEAGGNRAAVRVGDTGAGMGPEMLRRLFVPFERAERGPHGGGGGLGLGLALVKGLVSLHGGEVEAHSDGPGKGSEFVVRLPAAGEPPALAEPLAGAHPVEHPRRILVVEDNRDAAESLRLLLELLGHDVRVAHTGPEGVKAAQEWVPDVVLCDIGLPGLDGYGVAGELRSHPETAKVRLIAITGYGTDEDRLRARRAGFDHHLTKPANPDDLLQLVSNGA